MQRILRLILGASLAPLGAFLVFAGTLRVYRSAGVMTEANLSPDASGAALGSLLVGLLLAGVGYWIAKKGISSFRRGMQRDALPTPAGSDAASSPPQAAETPELFLTHAGQAVRLRPDAGAALLGRGADCRIVVHSKYVSRHHARIEWDMSGEPRLVNLGRSGTSVRERTDTAYRACDPALPLVSEGDIALYADGSDAESRGDIVHYSLAASAPEPVISPGAAKPVSGTRISVAKVAIVFVLVAGIVTWEFGGNKGAAPEKATTVAKGDAGKVEAILKTVINRSIAQRQEYEAELVAIGWTKILSTERIASDPTFAQSKAILRQAHGIVSKHRDGIDAHFARMRRDVEDADINPNSKRAMLKGMDLAIPAQKTQAAELWALEAQAIAQFDALFALLEARRKAWKLQEGKIVFSAQADLDRFNGYLSAVDAIVARQEALRRSATERARASFETAAK